MARKRNARVVVVEELRTMKRTLVFLLGRWTVSGMVYGDRSVNGGRARRPDEYPENDDQAWGRLFLELDAMIGSATKLREVARGQYWALKDEGEGQS